MQHTYHDSLFKSSWIPWFDAWWRLRVFDCHFPTLVGQIRVRNKEGCREDPRDVADLELLKRGIDPKTLPKPVETPQQPVQEVEEEPEVAEEEAEEDDEEPFEVWQRCFLAKYGRTVWESNWRETWHICMRAEKLST